MNQNVLEKISEARNTSDHGERGDLLLEGEKLLLGRNKPICLAGKYGWDTVECYTAEPLATNSSDEKHIKKAIKESKQLREEKRKTLTAKWKTKKLPQQDERPRRVVLEKSSGSFSVGKPSNYPSRDSQQTCFRMSAELQLQAKELNGPETVHHPQEANNSESIHTVHDNVVYFSGEFHCVEFEYAVHVNKVELARTTNVKGKLKERIAVWQSIGASRWVLEVLEDGYCLPFISLPQKAFFRNHYSVVEDEDCLSRGVQVT